VNALFLLKYSIKNFQELFKYGISGIILNLTGYFTYIILTSYGIDPKLTVVLIAPIFIFLTFIIQKNYIFNSKKKSYLIAINYLVLCFVGNLINIFFLYVFVDFFNFPHQIIQLLSMLIIGLMFYLCLKYYIF